MRESWPNRILASIRRRRCPKPTTLAAFVDRSLDSKVERRLRAHLSACPDCSCTVKELHLLSQAPLPEVPPVLLGQARRLGGRPERLSGPAARWKVAAAFGAVGVALMLGFWLEGLGGSEPSITAEGFRAVRGEDPGDRVPALVFPEPDAVLNGQDLRLEWSRVAGAVSYEVVLLNAEGGLVESVSAGDSQSATLRSPLPPGVYFVSVSANLPEGRTVKSGFSRFTIEVPR